MSPTVFTTRHHEDGSNRVRESSANLPGQVHLCIAASRSTRLIELGMLRDFMSVQLEFSPDQARAIAAELLACADVLQPATGRA